MRMGQEVPDFAYLRSNPEIRMAIVPLLEREAQLAWVQAADAEVRDNAYGVEARDKILKCWTLAYALRQPDNIDQRVFESGEQLAEELDDIDVGWLGEQYEATTEYASPALEGLTDEQMSELKKVLDTIDLNELSGRAWWLLKAFLLTVSGDQLRDRSLLHTSTPSLTGTSDEPESTPGA